MLKNFRIIIISMLIIIILIISMIIILIKKDERDNPESDYIDTEFEIRDTYEAKKEILPVNNRNKYFAVEKILNSYIMYIKQMYGIIDFQKYDDIEIREDGINKLYSILDDEYIEDMKIKREQLISKIKEYEKYKLKINRMYIYEMNSSINLYLVSINIDEDELNILVKTDSNNMTFSIFLEDYIEKHDFSIDMNTENIKITDKQIEKNDNNIFKYININDEYMVIQYINSLEENLKNNIENAYNNLMEKEYRNKRFNNINEFSNYLEENKELLYNIKPAQFIVNYYEDYTEYVCTDQYNNYYIFKEDFVMNYTFKFDTYTIMTDKFKTTYETASNEQRVQMNIDKFIQMINRQDYRTSYNCIADSFKNNYFSTQEEFKNYVNNKFFKYNKFEFNNIAQKGNNIYVCSLSLTDLTEQSTELKEIDIIIKLNDNFDFVMSFAM